MGGGGGEGGAKFNQKARLHHGPQGDESGKLSAPSPSLAGADGQPSRHSDRRRRLPARVSLQATHHGSLKGRSYGDKTRTSHFPPNGRRGAGSPEQRRHRKEPSFTRVFQQCLSRPKELRPVINLKPFSRFIRCPHFQMTSLKDVFHLVQHNGWAVCLDLKDAYFHIPVHPRHRRFLQFIWQGQAYRYRYLPFGLSSSPRTFTRVTKPIAHYLRSRGIRVVFCLDEQATNRQDPPEFRVHPQHREVRPNPETMLHVFRSSMGHTGSVSEPPSGRERGDTSSGRVVVGLPLHHLLGQSDYCINRCASRPSAHQGRQL